MAAPRPLTLRARAALRRWRPTLSPLARASLRPWRELPFVLVGIPVDPDAAHEHAAALAQLRDYINSHEETGFYLQERHFHICRAHPAARAAIARGLLPAAFRCPRGLPASASPLASSAVSAESSRSIVSAEPPCPRRTAVCPLASASALVPGRALLLRVGVLPTALASPHA